MININNTETTVNKLIKRVSAVVVCLILAAVLSLQAIAYDPSSSAAAISDEMKKLIEDESIISQLDEMLDLYVEYGLYGLTREQAVNLMLKNFVLNNQDMIPEMADSLLRAFDDFGGYYANTSMGELFGDVYWGYGIAFDGKKMADGNYYNITVKKLFKDSPALNAGVSIGDEIIKINNISVEGMGLRAISDLLAATDNKMELTVKRNGKEIKFNMEKNVIYVSSITYTIVGEKRDTALITIDNFSDEGMVHDFYMVAGNIQQEKYKNLIIDLRDNTGGDMDIMAEILNMLTPEKDVVLYSLLDKDGEVLEYVKSSGGGLKLDNICVLTNGYTASASEIFALSLSEITGAVIIGEKTYGKGIGQIYTSLENDDVVAITAFEIESSKGVTYNKKGLDPHIKIAPKLSDVKNNKFDQLNFVNCVDIKKGADNKAVLALNQRLARIGYLSPDDITSKCTDKTITAVEIFQKYNNLPVGISKIDFLFIDYLNYYTAMSEKRFEETDVQFECALKYIFEGKQAAESYAKNIK